MIDITIVICANLIVIMMAFTSECVEPLLPFQTISHTILLTIAGPALSTDGQSSLSDLTSQI